MSLGVKVGFLGCGEIVRTRHLPALSRVHGCDVTGLADIASSKLDLLKDFYPAATRYSSNEDLIASPQIDVVAVCGPPEMHSQAAIAALQAGKHVLVEKPLALSLEECEAISQAAELSGRQILTGMNMRWHRLAILARSFIAAGELGEITAVRSVFAVPHRRVYMEGWRSAPDGGGDLVNDLAVHHLDLLLYLLGSSFESVFASYAFNAQYAESAAIHLKLEIGISADLLLVSGAAADNRVELYGSKGSLLVDFYRYDGMVFTPKDQSPGSLKFRILNSLRSTLQLPGAIRRMRQGGDTLLSYGEMWQDFVDGIAGKKTVDFNLQDSIHVIQCASAVLASMQTGQAVRAAEAPRNFTVINQRPSAPGSQPASPVSISAIVVVPESIENFKVTLLHLSRQTIAHQMEIVVILPDRKFINENDLLVKSFFDIQMIEVGEMSSIAQAKVTGVRQAKSALVVMTEDHSYPEPGWAEALVAAHRRPFAAVGPQLQNANPDSMVSWADFYIAYGEWVDHRAPIFTRHLPGHNSCYKRQILLDYGEELERLLEAESILHWDLKQKGHELLLETAAKTHHLNFSYWHIWIPVQFHSGRIFAATRAHSWNPGKRLLFSIASPLIPIIRSRRIYHHVRRGQSLQFFLKLLPTLATGLILDAIGQVTGCLFGEGNSPEKAAIYEFNRVRYIRRPMAEIDAK